VTPTQGARTPTNRPTVWPANPYLRTDVHVRATEAVPPRTDFERGVGHVRNKPEELYPMSARTLTMRCGDDAVQVSAPAVLGVDPDTR
jgi:hypothetical protein